MEDGISKSRLDELDGSELAVNTQKRLVIFSDYGLDDACAAAYLLNNRSEYDSIDIIPVAGNVFCATAYDNCKKLLGAARDSGIDLRGVRMVDCVTYYQQCHVLPHIHGNDGMGDLFDDVDSSPVPALPFGEWCKSTAGGYRVLSLGPCTMVKRAAAEAANCSGGKTVIMGGCNDCPPNFGKYEFNDGIDHEAFLWCLRRPHVAATLDTCHIPPFDTVGLKFGDSLLGTLMNRCTALAVERGDAHNYIYDQIAALALVHPEYFDVTPRFVPRLCRDMYELSLKPEFYSYGYGVSTPTEYI